MDRFRIKILPSKISLYKISQTFTCRFFLFGRSNARSKVGNIARTWIPNSHLDTFLFFHTTDRQSNVYDRPKAHSYRILPSRTRSNIRSHKRRKRQFQCRISRNVGQVLRELGHVEERCLAVPFAFDVQLASIVL